MTSGYEVIAEVATVQSLSKAIEEKQPDFLLSDYHLGEGSIVEALNAAKKIPHSLKLIIFSDGIHSESLYKSLQNFPVETFFLKERSMDEILKALNQTSVDKLIACERS